MLASEERGIYRMGLARGVLLSMCPRWCAPGQAVWGDQDGPKQGVAAGRVLLLAGPLPHGDWDLPLPLAP